MSGTIRSRMEAQRDRHTPLNPKNPYCPTCGRPGDVRFPCPDRVAADDTLTDLAADDAFLDKVMAERDRAIAALRSRGVRDEEWRLIPDPDSRGAT